MGASAQDKEFSPDRSTDGRDVRLEQHCDDDDAAAKRPRQGQKHLYLVIDDWEMGYSIHKLDVGAFQPTCSDTRSPAPSGSRHRRIVARRVKSRDPSRCRSGLY
jgi:hypothetical protein